MGAGLMLSNSSGSTIPNIDLGQTYDQRYDGADIHIDSLQNLANFFGRDMPVHRHDRFYQIHWLNTGEIAANLDDRTFRGSAPLFYFTPPTVPHAFVLNEHACGWVLTVHQHIVQRLINGYGNIAQKKRLECPVFCETDTLSGGQAKQAEQLPRFMALLAEEFYQCRAGRTHTLLALVNLILVGVFRLSKLPDQQVPVKRSDIQIFQHFNQLIEQCYHRHWPLTRYARELAVTQSRLSDICRRVAGNSPKSLVYERLIQEAKWLLLYTAKPVANIGMQLGFSDPAYFCRFFTRHTQLSPREYRRLIVKNQGHLHQ